MTREFIDFVNAHKDEDTARLLLSAGRYPSIDMPATVQQIEGLRAAREKWPSLLQYEEFLYPPRLNREQASSETTARYKAQLIAAIAQQPTIADLTGGMGVDSMAFASVAARVDYVERDPQLCSLMEHNCRVTGLQNVGVSCADSLEWLAKSQQKVDILFVDPARRSASGRKVSAFEDCEPDILQHLPLLRSLSGLLLVKASPMIDIDLACRQLGHVSDVHVVAVRGECKEVLFLCRAEADSHRIHCVNLKGDNAVRDFAFSREEELSALPSFCTSTGRYLYEPDAALMKGGPYNLICQWFGLEKLGRNTHLYTADRLVADFPGRVFEVLSGLKAGRKDIAAAVSEGKAHVVIRNYPVAAADLQRQLGLKEGGDLFVLATTLGSSRKLFLCRQVG